MLSKSKPAFKCFLSSCQPARHAGTQTTMFDTVLIANRGEIACRVMRTAKRLGVKTVAVFSDADRHAQHVKLADEAYHIGPPAAAQSYLRQDKILQVAADSGAQAIHPGYGFLSENATFADACESAGVTFIGPPSAAITAMGSKSASKEIMIDAAVPVTPGYHGAEQDPKFLKEKAAEIGYPVMIKAVMGGGGKGMRIVRSADEFDSMLEACQREARASFGDDRVLLEKYLVKPRHIEFQVFADKHGNAVHLFERDCSVQRRHQKVLEEAPAPGLSSDLRARMGKSAVDAAKAVGYVGAGTVEFMLDTDGSYYFMEMNTRLQVEHPVTELITKRDLVQLQLEVAAGSELPMRQEDLQIHGHAIEARIYAEQPSNNFLPATGTLHYLKPPQQTDRVRVDTGVIQGDEVSIFYDPMISKLITWGPTRSDALRTLSAALQDYHIVGVPNNIEFVHTVANHPKFAEGGVDTSFLEKYLDEVIPKDQHLPDCVPAIAVAAAIAGSRSRIAHSTNANTDVNSPWSSSAHERPTSTTTECFTLLHGDNDFVASIDSAVGGEFQVDINGKLHKLSGRFDGSLFTAFIDGNKYTTTVVMRPDGIHVNYNGRFHRFAFPKLDFSGTAGAASDALVVTPMPGKVVKVMAKAGDSVSMGEPLMILEAMKMEHVIKAPVSGVIEAIGFETDDFVTDGAVLVRFAESEE